MSEDIPEVPAAVVGPWAAQALCALADLAIFFPPRGSKGTQARQICAGCPVHVECLEYALASNQEFGIWGGLDPRERTNLKRRLKRQQAPGAFDREDGAA